MAWTNKELDSTLLMVGLLGVFTLFVGATIFVKEYVDNAFTLKLMDFFNNSLIMMISYFFGKSAGKNSTANGEIHEDKPGSKMD